MKETEVKRGQPITFRVPSDTPDHILKLLQNLKKSERRNFSSKMAEFVISGVSASAARQREVLTIPLPRGLSKAQRDWLKHEHSEALLGSIVYQLLTNPIRTASLFASLNSNALEIDEALYLQEETAVSKEITWETSDSSLLTNEDNRPLNPYIEKTDDDLDNFDWDTAEKVEALNMEKDEVLDEVDELEDLLGDFLAQMNK